MARLWRYQPVSDEWTTHHVMHPDGVVVSALGMIDGYEWFAAEDSYVPSHEILTIEEVTPTEAVQAALMGKSPNARLLAHRMQAGPPRYSADDAARLALFVGIVPGIEDHIAEGRAWETDNG